MTEYPSLESQLAALREAGAQRNPPGRELVVRLVAELEASVILSAPKVGNQAPDFELKTALDGRTVRLSNALKNGTAVLSFYRGHW